MLAALLAFAGPDRMVFGSDAPFVHGDRADRILDDLTAAGGGEYIKNLICVQKLSSVDRVTTPTDGGWTMTVHAATTRESKGAVIALMRALARERDEFLLSDDSAFMSGQTLAVDGGSALH